MEAALTVQADAQARRARPDEAGDVASMRAEFDKAVATLKTSRLGASGRDALAVLPWYMIIGPPGGGKSTALRASGLQFPYRQGRVRGVGGTRNCDWWLTNQAVLLDTAGRYSTQEEDRPEWLDFLDMLKKTRTRLPINGVIVAVPVSDLEAGGDEAAHDLGRKLRERVDEMVARLEVVVPVYVLFTKCDLIPGFVKPRRPRAATASRSGADEFRSPSAAGLVRSSRRASPPSRTPWSSSPGCRSASSVTPRPASGSWSSRARSGRFSPSW
jgi:type VI secretion system protein ImpL